jgi:SPP1 gp7 family putative phage head morphogenesis protein
MMQMSKKKNPGQKYWQGRFEQLQQSLLNNSDTYYDDLDKIYKQANMDIQKEIDAWYRRFAKNNCISLVDAKKLLTSDELKEFKWTVEDYIKYGEKNAINQQWMEELENASAKVHISRLEALQVQLQQRMEILFNNQIDDIDKLVKGIYTDGYFHTAYEIQKGFNTGFSLHTFNNEELEKIVSKPWASDGKNFSERIWGEYRPELVNVVHTQLTQTLVRGVPPDRAIKSIADKFNTTKSRAGNLVMTESAYFSSLSRQNCFNDLGIGDYEIVATLDGKTSDICIHLDGEHFPLSEYEVWVTAPPFHNRCRSTTCPYFKDEIALGEERAARNSDGKTHYIDSNIKYPDWEKQFVKDGSSDIIKNKKTPFTPAKTVKEAEEYATKLLGIPQASYKGVDVVTANAWNEGLKDSFDRFPALKDNFGFVGECHERNNLLRPVIKEKYLSILKENNPDVDIKILEEYAEKSTKSYMKNVSVSKDTFAQSWSPNTEECKPFRGVTVNRDFGKDSEMFIEALQNNVESKFHPISCDTIRSVLDHEIGHQLDDLLKVSNNEDIRKLFDSRTRDEITNDLSKYSWKNNNSNRYGEFIAEGWSEYCNNPNPRPVAKGIGETIERMYKEWEKKNL